MARLFAFKSGNVCAAVYADLDKKMVLLATNNPLSEEKALEMWKNLFFLDNNELAKKKKHFLDYFKILKDNFAKSKKRACKSAPEDVSTVLPRSVGSYMTLKKMNQLLSQLEDLIKNKPKKDTPPGIQQEKEFTDHFKSGQLPLYVNENVPEQIKENYLD